MVRKWEHVKLELTFFARYNSSILSLDEEVLVDVLEVFYASNVPV